MPRPDHPTRSPRPPVTPSSRDGIESWLDVLTAMLDLPPDRKGQVRDELEDHLRSRVDDLLILGKSEPEAIRTAVAELGETAELAKLISNAHTRTHPRRRIMNIILTAAALAGLSLGTLTLAPSANPPTQSAGIAEPVHQSNKQIESFDIESENTLAILEQVAQRFGREFVMSDQLRQENENWQIGRSVRSFRGEYTLDEAVNELRKALDTKYAAYHLSATGDKILLQSLDEYNRSRIAIRVYPMPSWATREDERGAFAISVRRLLEAKHDLSNTTIEPINGTLVVAAAPEIHAEIVDMAEQLKALLTDSREQQQQAEQAARAQRMQAIERVREEFAKVRDTLILTRKEESAVQTEYRTVRAGPFDDSIGQEELRARQERMRELQARIDNLELKEEELEARYTYLQSRLIESEYEELTALLD